MSDVISGIGKFGKVIGGVAIGGLGIITGQEWLLAMGIQITVGGVRNLLQEPGGVPSAQQRERGRLLNVLSNESSVPLIYGRTKVGVSIVDVRLDPADSDILYVVAALCLGSEDGSGIEAVEGVYFDDKLAIDAPVFESEPATTGVQSPFTSKLEYGLHAGADTQTVDAELDSVFSQYDADTAGRGVAYMMLKLTYDPSVYATGIPNITAVVKGRQVYDPRSTSWVWSDSPALCVLDYLTSKRCGGGALYSERDGGSTSEIDEQSFIDAANYEDDTVTMGPGTDTRLTCNGRLDTGNRIGSNLADLLSSGRLDLVYEAGKFRVTTSQVQTAETFELTPDNIIGEVQYWRGGTEQVPNRIICHYVDEDNEWLPQEVTWPEPDQTNSFLSADNDFENVLEISLPFTVGHYRAQQIGMIHLREAREDTGLALTAKEEALKLRVGNVVPVTWPRAGFDQTEFRVKAIGLNPDDTVRLVLAEYDAAAYTIDPQNTRDTLPASSLPDVTSIAAPTGLTFTSGDSTVLVTQGGAITPRILFGWTPPADPFLDHYNVQIKLSSDSTWRDAGRPIAGDASIYINGVVEGLAYDVQIQAVNVLGVTSSWVQITSQTVATHSVLPLPQNVNDTVQALNGDFEGGLAYWGAAFGAGVMSLETTSPINGSKSLKITKAAAANVDVYQVTDARDVDKGVSGRYLYLRVQPGDQVRVRGSYYTDTIDARAGIRQFDQDKVHVAWQTTTHGATPTASAFDNTYTVPSGVYYVCLFLSTTTAATTGAVYFDDVMIERLVDAGSVQSPFDLSAHSVKFDLGTIGGWDMDATTISAGGASGVVLDSSVPSITLGGAGGIVLDGSVPSIEIGGASGIVLDATAPSLSIGGASGPLTGAGVWAGIDGGAADWRAGNPAGQYIHWDGSTGLLTLAGQIVYAANFAGSAQIGWEALVRRALNGARNLLFNGDFEDGDNFWSMLADPGGSGYVAAQTNATNARTGYKYLEVVTQATTASNGSAVQADDQGTSRYYPVVEGDMLKFGGYAWRVSGTKSVRYILETFDKDKAHVAYVGSGNATSGSWELIESTYTVAAGVKYVRLYAEVYDNTIASATTGRFDDAFLKVLVSAGDIIANTITATEIGSLVFTGKTANFDTGTVGGWTMASGSLSSTHIIISSSAEQIRIGASPSGMGPLTGSAGIWMGKDGSDYELRVGDPAGGGDYFHWDGSALAIESSSWRLSGGGVEYGTGYDFSDKASSDRYKREFAASYIEGGAGVDVVVGKIQAAHGPSAITDLAELQFFLHRDSSLDQVASFRAVDEASGERSAEWNVDYMLWQGARWGPWHKDSSTRTHTGDTTETTILTATVPADSLGTDGGVWLRVWGLVPTSGGSLRVKFGGSNFAQFTGLSAGTFELYVEIHNQGATNSQQCWAILHSANGATGRIERNTAFTKDTTSDQDVVVSFALSNSGQTFTINHSAGEYLPIAA